MNELIALKCYAVNYSQLDVNYAALDGAIVTSLLHDNNTVICDIMPILEM